MSATDAFENKLLSLIFENANAANIGDAAGLLASAAPGNFRISLHTGTLGEASVQNTTEAAYGPYIRVSVARSTAGWTVATGNVDNDNAITFAAATSGSETETDFGIGFNTSGAGSLDIYGALTSGLAVSNGITPEFAAGFLDISIN